MTRTEPTNLIDRIIVWSFDHPLPTTLQYALATLTILTIGLIRVLFVPDSVPWLLFIPATIAVALVTGRSTGYCAAGLSAVVGIASLGTAEQPAWLTRPQWIAAGLYLLVMLGLVLLVTALRDAMRRARALNAELVERERQAVEREGFLSGVLASSTDCIKVLDLAGRLTFMSEGGQRIMGVDDFAAIANCPWVDFWEGSGHAEAAAAVAAARAGRSYSFIGQAATMGGVVKWWHVAVSPIRGLGGRPDRILSVSRDISALKASEEDRDRFVRLAENSTDFIGMAHMDGRLFYLNDAARQMVGLEGDHRSRGMTDVFVPEQVDTVLHQILPAVARDGHWAGELCFRHFGTGEQIPVLYAIFSLTDAAGRPNGYAMVTRDYRDLKRVETDLRFLNGELAHRLKNVLAVVQSVAQQTLRSATDLDAASHALGARLVALGAATDVLTNSAWRSADLCELATRALAPHGTIGECIIVRGPSVLLKPEVTVAFVLALHELATNAAKYGALSREMGSVTLTWQVEGTGADAAFSLQWRERDGPPVVPPTRTGFGSTLIERSLRSYFRGKAATHYRPDGLVFELQARLGDAAVISGD